MSQTVLITQHAPHEHPAYLKRALDSQFIRNFTIKVYENCEFPPLENILGLVSLGGPMSANDEKLDPWILKEIDFMQKCYRNNLPILGICLGGQMLARALGGKVIQNPHPEIGWYPVFFSKEAEIDPFLSQISKTSYFYQWHYDSFLPPPQAIKLAKSTLCDNQIFSMNSKTYGFQFHPEVDHGLIQEWLNIEGTDEEILLAKMAHHHECVQEPKLHLEKAKEHELQSIFLLTLMTSLFNKKPFLQSSPEATKVKEKNLFFKNVVVTLKDIKSDNQFSLYGNFIFQKTFHQGEYLFFRENSGFLWPFREDYIFKVE